MKKLLLTASALVIVAAFSSAANAECNGIYGALRGGLAEHKGTEDGGKLDNKKLMLSGALGYRYDYFRTELEYVWRKKSTDNLYGGANKLTFRTYSYMWNVYYDIMPFNWWTPYVGAGLGWTKMRYQDYDSASEMYNSDFGTTKFTWSLGAGLSLKVTNRWNVDAGYRYYRMGKLKQKEDIKAQEIYGGIRYVF